MIDEKVDIRIAELGKLISFGFQCLGSPYEFDSGVPVGIRATHGSKYHLVRELETTKVATKFFKLETLQNFDTDEKALIFIPESFFLIILRTRYKYILRLVPVYPSTRFLG